MPKNVSSTTSLAKHLIKTGGVEREILIGHGRTRRKDIKKGKDIQVDIEIELAETLKPIVRQIRINKLIFCSRCVGKGAEPGTKLNECFSCRGTGQVQQVKRTILGSYTTFGTCPECKGEGTKPEKPCNVCKGEGRLKGNETIDFTIPAGIDNNQAIEIPQKGDAGKKGGKAGDLYVRVYVKKHPVFARKGDDLYLTQEIAFSQAALGDEIEIPALEGTQILLTVPAGTESGRILRVSGKGIPNFGSTHRGNMYVELLIKIPKKLNKEQKDLLGQLKEKGL